jgi:thymidylate kinase
VRGFSISIDGPDGAGKSTLSKLLTKELRKLFPQKNVILIKPSYFSESDGGKKIEREFNNTGYKLVKYSKEHNSYFLRAMMANYEELVIPAAEKGEIIILDSSEIRALAFIMDNGDNKAIQATIELITNNTLTIGFKPDHRFFVYGEIDDLLKNLYGKKSLDPGDPTNYQESARRIECYEKAIKMICRTNPINYIKIEHIHCDSVENYLLKVIQQYILPRLFNSPVVVKGAR